jgi:hypothetical protein
MNAFVGPLYIVNWNAWWNSEICNLNIHNQIYIKQKHVHMTSYLVMCCHNLFYGCVLWGEPVFWPDQVSGEQSHNYRSFVSFLIVLTFDLSLYLLCIKIRVMKCERNVSQVRLRGEANFKAPLPHHFVNIDYTTTIKYVYISPSNFPEA